MSQASEAVEVYSTGRRIPVTDYVPEWGWRCGECGWVSLGHYNEQSAERAGQGHDCAQDSHDWHWDDYRQESQCLDCGVKAVPGEMETVGACPGDAP